MTFNTSECQTIFRNRFTGPCGEPFVDFNKGKAINNMAVESSDLRLYKAAKAGDIANFYYKALLSFSEGIAACLRGNYTWATIKLYYSVYFGLRSSLLCRNIVLVRALNHLYKFSIASGAIYEKPQEMNDHGGTILTYISMFEKTDFFCSNPIEGKKSYNWLKGCRELVNYKDGVFHDPTVTPMWECIVDKIVKDGAKKCLRDFVDDRGRYCFLPEFAVVALPLNRIIALVQEVKNECEEFISIEQKEWIESILYGILDDELLKQLLN